MRLFLALAVPLSLVYLSRPAALGDGPFPPAKEGLSIPPFEDKWTIETLLREYSRVTDQNVTLEYEARYMAENIRLGLLFPAEVPAESVHSFVEGILLENNFVVMVVHNESPRVLAVRSLRTGANHRTRQEAAYVPSDELNLYASHPAFAVTTTLSLPKTDVLALSRSFRSVLRDPDNLKMIPIAASNSVVVSGLAPGVIALVQALEQVEANAPEPAPTLVPGQAAKGR